MSNSSNKTNTIGDAIEAVLSTTGWMLLLTFGLPMLSAILIMFTGIGALLLPDVTSMEELELNSVASFLIVLLSYVFVCILLKSSLGVRTMQSAIQGLALGPIYVVPLVAVAFLAVFFSGVETSLMHIGLIAVPEAMLSIAAQANTTVEVLLLFITVGILVPFFEELIFRGVAFARLRHSVWGVSGAIIIPSVVFTLSHTQYEQIAVFVLLFLSSILFGLIRHMTGNLWYCVAAHIVMNLYALAYFFV